MDYGQLQLHQETEHADTDKLKALEVVVNQYIVSVWVMIAETKSCHKQSRTSQPARYHVYDISSENGGTVYPPSRLDII